MVFKRIGNLTGHCVDIVNDNLDVVQQFYVSRLHEPLRAEVYYKDEDPLAGCPVIKALFHLNITQTYMHELESYYDAVIVSKITGECLREMGFKGEIYIPSKLYKKNGLTVVGCKKLSRLN